MENKKSYTPEPMKPADPEQQWPNLGPEYWMHAQLLNVGAFVANWPGYVDAKEAGVLKVTRGR